MNQDQQSNEDKAIVDWKAKYEKEHDRKKKLNKSKKKAYKRVKKLTKANQKLEDEINKVKSQRFLAEHDYF